MKETNQSTLNIKLKPNERSQNGGLDVSTLPDRWPVQKALPNEIKVFYEPSSECGITINGPFPKYMPSSLTKKFFKSHDVYV